MLDNNSKATSFLYRFKMIAKLEWTQSYILQSKVKHILPQTMEISLK